MNLMNRKGRENFEESEEHIRGVLRWQTMMQKEERVMIVLLVMALLSLTVLYFST